MFEGQLHCGCSDLGEEAVAEEKIREERITSVYSHVLVKVVP